MSLLQKVRKPICEKFWAHGKHHMAKVLTIIITIVMATMSHYGINTSSRGQA